MGCLNPPLQFGEFFCLAFNVNHLRARGPRPYLDKNKQIPNGPAGIVGAKCQGRGKTGGFPARHLLFQDV